ncbi:hypothetical protein [Curtobacterium sp. ME26]|uniref:hypothetical protein n=1 Tax=Curtobacterium sp. ME26 TaxID=2744254 RepID=UPI0015F75182|nr:hypothetical protein [Curtobacterium sp. ME26]
MKPQNPDSASEPLAAPNMFDALLAEETAHLIADRFAAGPDRGRHGWSELNQREKENLVGWVLVVRRTLPEAWERALARLEARS